MRIALIGSAPSSVKLGPSKDLGYSKWVSGRPQLERGQHPFIAEEWNIWACSPGTFGVVEKIDRFFETHRWEPGKTWFSPEYCQFLCQFKGTVYTGEVIPEIKNSVRLPRELLIERFSPFFFTSSLALMAGMAILEIEADRAIGGRPADEKDVIGFWGVDMAATEEWAEQRPGCQFFMLEAQRRGIEIALPPESDLCRPMPMYGVCEWSHAHIKALARRKELEARLQNATVAAQNANSELYFFKGAMENQDYNMKTWLLNDTSPMVPVEADGKQLVYLPAMEYRKAANE